MAHSLAQSVVEEIKQRIDIVEFIARYVPLKKAGTTYKANCPFHNERTPSFVVYPQNSTWRCFGACGVGGDVYSFLMRKENLDFREVLEILAHEVGIDLSQNEDSQAEQQRKSLYAINLAAATYFQEVLRHHPAAQQARDYIERRQIDAATQERFLLGFALPGWDSLRDHLERQGFGVEQQLAAGLLKRHEERGSTYDAFRNRVMIPIRDRQGRMIGFGGRVLDESLPKYLNTAETQLFHKSRVVYGLDLAHAAIRHADKVVIVEGYMDVIAAHQHGHENVVACMGTALTTDQLQQLQRYTSNFVLALDADAAGQQATLRGLNQARQALSRSSKPTMTSTGLQMEQRLNATLAIVAMPDGLDPDDLIRQDARQGTAQWRQLVADAKPLVDFYFDMIAAAHDLETPQGKGLAVSELAPLIAELGDEIERQHYIQRLSRLVRIDEITITGRVQAAAKTLRTPREQARERLRPKHFAGQPRATDGADATPPPVDMPAEPPAYLADDSFPYQAHSGVESASSRSASVAFNAELLRGKDQEDYLVASLLQEPDLLIWLTGVSDELEIAPPRVNDLENVENQEVFRALKRFISSDNPWDLELFQETLTSHLHGRLGYLMAYGTQLPQRNANEVRTDLVKVLVRMRIQQLKADNVRIKYLLDEAHQNEESDVARSLASTNNQNLRERFHLERTLASLSRLATGAEKSTRGLKVM